MITLDWNKATDGLLPAVIQDAQTRQVLMLGYMNAESFALTQKTGRIPDRLRPERPFVFEHSRRRH